MNRSSYAIGRTFVGRLPAGIDLLEGLTRIANEEEIAVGRIEVYGSVSALSLTVQNQETRFAEQVREEQGFEIATLCGTISLFKRRALPRLSGLFAAADGTQRGGTLALGTITHACEAIITELTGRALSRDFDMTTGLPLWKNALLLEEESRE
jgi:predicted DNA-binding protein with PD1-like motif